MSGDEGGTFGDSIASVKHQSETHIIANAMIKQSKVLSGFLKQKTKQNKNKKKKKKDHDGPNHRHRLSGANRLKQIEEVSIV